MASEGTPLFKFGKLLHLPVEIRLEILHFAILCPIPCDSCDAAKVCLGSSDFRHASIRNRQRYYWGTERMTRLLRVNHQLHAEAEEVLYTSFLFCFPPAMSLRSQTQ